MHCGYHILLTCCQWIKCLLPIISRFDLSTVGQDAIIFFFFCTRVAQNQLIFQKSIYFRFIPFFKME